MIKLYTLKFNNYFNRKVLKFDTVDEYLVAPYFTSGHVTANVSFDIKDGVTTEQIINYNANGDDYALLVNETVEGGVATKTILSRWYISEAVRQRTGQFMLSLRRDVIVDNYEGLKGAPIFVQKGKLNQEDNMICNDEGFIVNRVKVGEKLLKQSNNNSAWLIGYVDKGALGLNSISVTPEGASSGISVATIASDVGITELQLVNLLNLGGTESNPLHAIGDTVEFNYGITSTYYFKEKAYFDRNLNCIKGGHEQVFLWTDIIASKLGGAAVLEIDAFGNLLKDLWNSGTKNKLLSIIKTASTYEVMLTKEQYDKLHAYNGKVVTYNGVDYTINFNFRRSQRIEYRIPNSNLTVEEYIEKYQTIFGGRWNFEFSGNIYIWNTEIEEYIMLTPTVSTTAINIPFASENNRKDTAGSPTDIFAIPFGPALIGLDVDHGGQTYFESFKALADKDLLYKIASTIATQLDAKLYDIQLLPYCPLEFKEDYYERMAIDTTILTEHTDFDFITQGANKVSAIFWLKNANFTFDIPLEETVADRKIESQTKLMRFCSPNYQGLFDFNVAKNNGLDKVIVNCSYKPYNPYIQVLPNFKGLYGGNFNDYRGLICSGDFSLARLSDAWISYQLNNKNFQNIFNRDMQNLDLSQRQQKLQEAFRIGGGVVAGGAGGAVIGAKAGGPYGAIAGAVLGTGAGIAGGVIDYNMAEQVRAEQRDYAKDKYGYSLGNIQALPNSITKVDTFIINSKLFPFIEYYESTEEEKQALIDKITYDGMSVERIGTIEEFASGSASNYFKGQLIRADNIHKDTHLVNTIYDEIMKGLYI